MMIAELRCFQVWDSFEPSLVRLDCAKDEKKQNRVKMEWKYVQI